MLANLFTNLKGKILQKKKNGPCHLCDPLYTWIVLKYPGKSISDTLSELPLIRGLNPVNRTLYH